MQKISKAPISTESSIALETTNKKGLLPLKILVTGSSGLIGSAVCANLQAEGFDVLTMDIRNCQGDNSIPCFGDILNGCELRRAVDGVEGIIHLAGVSRVAVAQENPTRCLQVNVGGLKNLIEAMKKQCELPWIIFASSKEVYGEPQYLPVDEGHILNPINVYGKSKQICESMLANAAKSGIVSLIYRFSNVYGSIYDYPTRVIPAFLGGAIDGKPLRVDSPDHVFDFTYVGDVAMAIAMAVDKMAAGEFTGANVFNLSPGKGTSLTELLEIIKNVIGKEVATAQGKQRSYDVVRYVGNCAKLKSAMGYECRVQLKQGLEQMCADYLTLKELVC
jgi:UDP-glucose 4-epimerase